MDLPIRSIPSLKELQAANTGKVQLSAASKPATKKDQEKAMMNRWLNESKTDTPWMHVLVSNIHNGRQLRLLHNAGIIEEIVACLEKGVLSTNLRPQQDQPNHLLDQVPDAATPPSLSDGSSHNEEDQTAAGVFGILTSRAAQVLHINEQTGGQDREQTTESRSAETLGREADTGKAKGKRAASSGDEASSSWNETKKQVSEPKRLKVARPPTRAGGRLFACLFLKRDPNYCQSTHCAGYSTPSIETVIRHWLKKHVDQGDLDAETHKTIKDMKRNYNMSIPGQDEELWIASYMTLFCVSRSNVPSPFVSLGIDDLSTVLASRLNKQPAFAIELVTFLDQAAAMRHRHEEGREELQRRYETIEVQRVEQVKFETRTELTIAKQQHEDVCKHERESLKANFEASLSADIPSVVTAGCDGAAIPADSRNQEVRGTIDHARNDDGVIERQPYTLPPVSDANVFSDSGYGSNETYCYICSQVFWVDSEGYCICCRVAQQI